MIHRLTKKRNINKSQNNVKSSNAKHQLTKKHINRKSQNRKTKLYKVRKGLKGFKGVKGKKTVQKGGLVCEQPKKPKKGFFKTIFGKKNKTDDYIPMNIDCFRNNLLEMLKTRKSIMLKIINNRKTFLKTKIKNGKASQIEIAEYEEIKTKLNNVDNLYIHPYDDLIYRLYFKKPITDECYSKTTNSHKINQNPYKNIVDLLNLESFEKMGRMKRTYKDFIEEYQFLIDYENNKKLKDKIREQLNSVELYNNDYCYKSKNKNQVSSLPPPPNRNLKPKTNTKDIKHIWFTNWPDHGVPENMTLFRAFITYVYDDMKKDGNTVIHCSAGVGRTGVVYIILKLLSEQLLDKQLNSNTVLDKIDELIIKARQYRNLLFVQSLEQYIFIYSYYTIYVSHSMSQPNPDSYFNKILQERFNELNKSKHDLNTASGTGEPQTKCVLTDHKTEETDPYRRPKNRYRNILPCEKSRVILKQLYTKANNDYINASNMEPLNINGNEINIIAAQCPLQETIPDFYTMLDSYDIERIIMVTGLVEKGMNKCDNYFNFADTTTGSDNVEYNDNPITLTKSDDNSNKWGLIHTLSFTGKYPLKELKTPYGDVDVDL